MYEHILQKIGLPRNEAKIYETLLQEGELTAGIIATKSKVHRRNVYDSLSKLLDKELVFEIPHKHEMSYLAADPEKLMELVNEKESVITALMPDLQKIYKDTPRNQDVCIYRGVEARKNEMSDILRFGGDIYFIGAKGAWLNTDLRESFLAFAHAANKKNVKFHILFDAEMKGKQNEFKQLLKNLRYKFLPPAHSTTCDITIYDNKVSVSSGVRLKSFNTKEDSFTVTINQPIADSFRTWFKFLWNSLP